MGLFRVRNGSVVATLLGIAVVLDLVELCIAMNSRFQRFNSHNPSDSLMERKITIKMPGTHPQKTDTYLCTGVQLLPHKEYIVQFEPSASADRAHHMLLFGCIMPGAGSPSWDCNSGQYGACMGSEEILYAWAKNAPPKYLPEGVGFAIGGDSAIKYLVLQVHYANVNSLQDGEKDYSGFILHTRRKSLPYLGGIFLMWAYQGVIPPETSGVHVDVACQYKQSETMNAFAFRTHAHKLAKVITGYRIRNGIWTLLGKGDPQAPQAFYPMKTMIDIRTGDILAARCTYDSRGHDVHKVVHMGSSGHDEMCNFYIMYYSTAGRLEYSGGDCGEQNHPEIFKDFPADSDTPLSPIASTLPAHSVMSSDGMEAATTTEEYKEAANNPTVFPTDLASSEPEKTETKANVIGLPELRVLNNWPNLTAVEKSKLGQVTGVAVDSKGQVVIFHRGGRIWDDSTFDSSNVFRDADMVGTISEHTVWILDSATGKVRGFWGKDLFYLPHGLTIDHRDNLWVTDVGSHQVFKFSPLSDRTQRLLSLGHKLVPGADNSRFCKPTSVAVDKTGEFYVADGYCNSRIMKFSSTGKLMNIWGKPSYFGHGMPSLGSFMVPHSLALDRTQQRLFIADRENGRVQVMNSKSGAFIDEIKFPEFGGLVYAVDYSYGEQGGVLRIVNGPTTDKKRKVPVQGFTIRVADKALIQTWPSENRQSFLEPHDLTSSADGTEVYVVEIGPNRIWKLASTIPTITTELLDVLESKSQTLNTEESKNHSTNRVELVEEKAKLIPTHLGITKPGDGDKSLQQTVDNEKPESTTLDAVKSSASQKGGSGKEASVNSGNQNSTDEVKTVVYSTTGTPIGHPLDHQDSKSEKDNPTTDRDNTNSESHTLQAGTVRLRITEAAKPEPTPSGSSESTPKNDALDGDESQDSENITKGVIPALVILSILAVPIVFLLLISVVLRVRAFQRDRNRPTKGFHDSKNELTVGRTRGWWSYMNCFDKQRYRFNRVTLSDFYSDSDSDEV